MNEKQFMMLDDALFDISKIWQYQLHLEYIDKMSNVRIAFKDIGALGELLAISYNPGYIGSGSGGMGLDLVNRQTKKSIEVKSCCTIQNSKCTNKECPTGGKYNPLFNDKCPICKKKGKTISDSRFSINAKEFLEQYEKGFFENFTLIHIRQTEHDINNKKIEIKLYIYKIDFLDENTREIKLNYFKEQAKSGKKPTCNLLPQSFDFYKLCPVLIDIINIKLNYDDMSDNPVIKREIENKLRVPIKIVNDNEKLIFKSLKSFTKLDETVDMVDFTKNILYRKKTHGKNRGDTRRNAYKSVT